uniref:CVNH domain-containing protein n=1 Tax=Parastrongyloides trichosuri TaxID=131310 RepID=A0A0N5A714_PARTI
MKIDTSKFFTISIILFLTEYESTSGRACYTSKVFTDMELRLQCKNNFSIKSMTVENCYLGFFYYNRCYLWDKIENQTSPGNYSFSGSKGVAWGISFYPKITITHNCSINGASHTNFRSCNFWLMDKCYACYKKTGHKCRIGVDLSKPSIDKSTCNTNLPNPYMQYYG